MTTIRIAERRQFTVVCNETADDNRLSLRARGLMLWLLSKPDGWKINARLITTIVPEGRDAILTALKELETFGYLRHEKVQMPGGQWVTQTFLYESPGTGNQEPVNQDPGNQDLRDLVIKEKKENKTHQCDENFTKFWNAYRVHCRGGSPSAKKAWSKIDPEEHHLVMLGLTLWNKFWDQKQTEDKWVPMASTWLNDRRWESPPAPPTKTDGGPGPGYHWSERRQIWIADGMG